MLRQNGIAALWKFIHDNCNADEVTASATSVLLLGIWFAANQGRQQRIANQTVETGKLIDRWNSKKLRKLRDFFDTLNYDDEEIPSVLENRAKALARMSESDIPAWNKISHNVFKLENELIEVVNLMQAYVKHGSASAPSC